MFFLSFRCKAWLRLGCGARSGGAVVRIMMVMPLVLFGWVSALAQPPSLIRDTATVLTPAPEQAEVIPARPTHWFNDYTTATSPKFGANLDERLARLEKETSNQFVVAIFPKLPSANSLDHYCLRVFNAWGIGRKGVNNGVVLFVFLGDHKLRIQVGRGLETPLTDPVCQEIIEQMKPAFRRGDFEGGITTCIDAVVTKLQG